MKGLVYNSTNLNRQFIRAAKIIAGKISHIDGVVGIIAAGGIGRGHSDEFSDLDMIVYADSVRVKEIGKYIAVGQLYYKGIHFDIPVESYQKARRYKVPSSYWSQAVRWTLKNSRILHDTEDRVAGLLAEKVVFPDSERKKLMKRYRLEANEILNYMFPTWEARGEVYNLAHLLRLATESIMLWIYARNRKFQPYLVKWLFYHLENGFVPEARFFPVIKKVYVNQINNLARAGKIRKELIELCGKLGMDIHEEKWSEVIETNSNNWKKASVKTRYYLSW